VSYSNAFEELDKAKHDRGSFDCGEDELNDFIQTKASKHMLAGISKTFVLPANSPLQRGKRPICAFYSVTPSSIARENLPRTLANKLPHYPIPVFLIAQLAVHLDQKGQGLGKITLIKALEFLWNINAQMPAYAVVVDCLNQEAQDFYEHFGFEILCAHNGRTRMFLPMKTIGQLF
jgi:GNAT superfamily N-acetyltransferase